MSEIENRYHTNLLKHGFQEEAPNTSFNSIGKLYSVPRNLGEGVYWIYSQEDLYDIKIHDFHFFTDSFFDFSISEGCLGNFSLPASNCRMCKKLYWRYGTMQDTGT